MEDDVTINQSGLVTVVAINTDEVTLFKCAAIKGALEVAITPESLHLVIDLSEVDYVDSSGLGMIIAMNTKMKLQQGNVYLVAANHSIVKLLKMTRLDRTIRTFDTVPAVMHHIQLS